MFYNTVNPQLNGWYFNTKVIYYTYKNCKLFKTFQEYKIKVNSTTSITYTTKYRNINIITFLLWGNNVLRLRNILYILNLFVNLISSSTC